MASTASDNPIQSRSGGRPEPSYPIPRLAVKGTPGRVPIPAGSPGVLDPKAPKLTGQKSLSAPLTVVASAVRPFFAGRGNARRFNSVGPLQSAARSSPKPKRGGAWPQGDDSSPVPLGSFLNTTTVPTFQIPDFEHQDNGAEFHDKQSRPE